MPLKNAARPQGKPIRVPANDSAMVMSAKTTVTRARPLVLASVVYLAWQSGHTRYGLKLYCDNKLRLRISLLQAGQLIFVRIMLRLGTLSIQTVATDHVCGNWSDWRQAQHSQAKGLYSWRYSTATRPCDKRSKLAVRWHRMHH